MFRKLVQLNFVHKRFAGHSKWANIKHIKGAKDAERNVLFTKLARQIRVAVTEGGSSDPKKNLKLVQVIDQCKRFNMPLATLQSVLKSCENDKSNNKAHLIDIKGPGSCMVLCELYTNNLHVVKQSISIQLKKTKSKFADGSGLHMFHEKGIIDAENTNLTSKPLKEQLELATDHAIECNAEEVEILDGNIFQFLCSKQNFPECQKLLENLGYRIVNASVDYIPNKMQEIGPTDLELFEKLMKKLDEMPEVVRLFDNVN
ncbi:unnamed protein product [Ceutorhynchus assimilis]|uniref:Translational activator of cytochrome c oxidase 1 n=1 Tax=Ceutorhynchus assimilis TaxID=467358 RepID=A0A9N9QNS7_9CUCU|nr:unnamed protein product [Ceutorhynchus assimilis]